MSRVLALDPGTKRCGVAVSDSRRTMAFPRPALAVNEDLVVRLGALVEEEGIGLVVVGRPLALSGAETPSTLEADLFYAKVRATLHQVTVVRWDERLTTVQAQKSLSEAGMSAKSQRAHVDSAAAVVLLQNYLDAISPV